MRDNVDKGKAGQATDANVIQRVRFARWITVDLEAYPEYVIVNAFVGNTDLRACAIVLLYKYTACLVAHEENNSKDNNNRTEIGLEISSREEG